MSVFARIVRPTGLLLAMALVAAACATESNGDDGATDGATDAAADGAGDDVDDGDASPDPVTLTFVSWAAAGESTGPTIEQVIEEFEAEYPHITIDSVPQAVSDIVNQVITMAAGGNPPDVVQSQTLFTPTLHAAGFLGELQDASIDLGTIDGEVVGLPWFVAPLGFHFNKTLMEEVGLDPSSPPQTLDQMVEQIEAARAVDPNIIGFNIDTSQRDIGLDYNWALMRSFGAEPIVDECANADTGEFVDFLEWLQMMIITEHTLPGKLFGEFRDNAAAGDLLFAYDGSYFQGIVQGIDPDISDDDFYAAWGVAPLPAGITGENYATSSDHHLTLFNTSEHKEEALLFMEYLVTRQNAIETYLLPLGGLPALNDVSAYPQLDNPIKQGFVADVVPTVVRPPWGELYAGAADIVMSNVQRLFSASEDPAEVAAAIQAELEALYDC